MATTVVILPQVEKNQFDLWLVIPKVSYQYLVFWFLGFNVVSVEFRRCIFGTLDVKSCGTVLSTPHIGVDNTVSQSENLDYYQHNT